MPLPVPQGTAALASPHRCSDGEDTTLEVVEVRADAAIEKKWRRIIGITYPGDKSINLIVFFTLPALSGNAASA